MKSHDGGFFPRLAAIALCLAAVAMLASSGVAAQDMGHEDSIVDPVPPPTPPKTPDEELDELGGPIAYRPLRPDSEGPWVIDAKLLKQLQERADTYVEYSTRFSCMETARLANYGGGGKVNEKRRDFSYLLISDPVNHSVREFRELADSRKSRPEPDDPEQRFPPAYAWVFLFSPFNESFFSYRYLGNRLDGYDWVHEIEFKGSLPFTTGRDIREWEGTALIDAVTFTPIQILAEPINQRDLIEQRYRDYVGSSNILGFRTKPKPRGYKAEVEFRMRASFVNAELTFPTRLRHDVFEAVSTTQIIPVQAASRAYDDYRFFGVDVIEETEPKGGT